MKRLEGIIYKTFENFIVFRGYAPIRTLAQVSERPESYQRIPNEQHKRDIVDFLKKKEYSYFPELVFAYRGAHLNELIETLQGRDDIEYDAEKFVSGLKVLKERIPYAGNRARHAQLNVDKKKLLRVDGNHRLEPFDSDDDWWSYFITEQTPAEATADEKRQWLHQQIVNFRRGIDNTIVPFSVVISNEEIADKFEASIFNNINFKHLPLKQEKNIQNIHKFLKDSNELGKAHKLTMQMIDLVESFHFKGLSLFDMTGEEKEVYRTVCLKTIELLLSQQEKLSKIDIPDIKKEKKRQDHIVALKEQIKELKIAGKDEDEDEIKRKSREMDEIISKISAFQGQITKYENFIKASSSIDEIEIAIQSLRESYKTMGDECGNISLFVAFVYYKLLDEVKFKSFFNWVIRNGINKIPVEEYLPTHNAESLIGLFERVVEAKGKEIFISMQFGDPQSEMIYEKVRQAIERFNEAEGLDICLTSIRIDQKVTTELFNISNEITRAIMSSSLIIADLSSHNVNVYHEIGLATGLAKAKGISPSIILLYKKDTTFRDNENCNEDQFIGFNLRGESQLRFTTYKELTEGLFERLKKYYSV